MTGPLNDIVEESIVRYFGLVIAEDVFSSAGPLKYFEPSVDGSSRIMESSSRCLLNWLSFLS